MATISANGAKGHHKFTLTVTETSTSTANNTSSLSYSFTLSPIQTGWDWTSWGSKISYSIVINGTTYTGTIPDYNGSSTVTLKSGTQTVTHDSDGSKTISYSFSVTDGAGQSYTPGNASASGTMALTTIARQATLLTAPNFSYGENPTITYMIPSGASITALEACISWTGSPDIPYRAVPTTRTSYTFELTSSESTALLNACTGNSLTVRFYLRTTIGGSLYYSSLERTFSVDNANPIVSGNVVDTNSTTIALTGDSSKLIKYYSTAQASMTAEAQSGASIDESFYIIRNGNNTAYSNIGTFYNVESNVFTFSAEDSRGNVGTATVTPDMVDYIRLTCNISNNRPDAAGNMTVSCSGNYFNNSFGAVYNTLTVQYRYSVYGGTWSNWTDMDVSTSGNTYYASASLSGLDYQLTYSFETRAIDELSTITGSESAVKSTPIFHWGENDFVFEVPVTFNAETTGIKLSKVDGDLNVTGNLRLKGSGAYGNYLYFGDGSYCYLSELTDDVLTINAKRINLVTTNGVYVDGNSIAGIESGVWQPKLDSNAANFYTYQDGWYSKVGQTVTVGFYILAYCDTGYSGSVISISGLPYTPSIPAAGGGMCSGAYISGGYNFQCFVAELSGNITTRVQACNNTSTTNLSTSASGCCYRDGGGELTLSGTITYPIS